MSQFEILVIALTVLTAILIPTVALVIRVIVKETRKEDQIEQLVGQVKEIVSDNKESDQNISDAVQKVVDEQTRVHNEIYTQMRTDREATDRRLRFIEEYWMKRGQSNNG